MIKSLRREPVEVETKFSNMMQNCDKCDRVFVTKSALDVHLLCHSEDLTSKRRKRPLSKVPCGDCSEVFYRRCDLRLHRRMMHHVKKCCCGVCGKNFTSEWRLKMHHQFHNVGGEYECFYCRKEFNKGWKLKIHLVVHTGKAPYVCQYCKEDFLYPGKLLDHLKRDHDVFLACRDCGEAFANSGEQVNHVCKLYGCKDCLVCFVTAKELASHTEVHKKCEMKEENSIEGQVSSQADLSNMLSASSEAVASPCLYEEESILPSHNLLNGDVTPCKPSSDEIVQRSVRKAKDGNVNLLSSKHHKFGSFRISSEHSLKRSSRQSEQTLSKENIYMESKKKEDSCSRVVIGVGIVNTSSDLSADTSVDFSLLKSEGEAAVDNLSNDASTIALEQKYDDDILIIPKSGKEESALANPSVKHFEKLSRFGDYMQQDLKVSNIQDGGQLLSRKNLANSSKVENLANSSKVSKSEATAVGVNLSCFKQDIDSVSSEDRTATCDRPLDSLSAVGGTNNIVCKFKIPKSNLLSTKRFINILKRKPVKAKKSTVITLDDQESDFNKKPFLRTSDQTSLKSWLTSDNSSSSCIAQDFVFGIGNKEPQMKLESTYSVFKVKQKKEDDRSFGDMSFEDLCQF